MGGKALALATFAAFVLKGSLACNGYELKVNKIENCNPNNVIQLENAGLTLDKNCKLIPSGCIKITKPFQTAEVHYIITKPPLPTIEGNANMCEHLKNNNNMLADTLKMFDIPKQCPIPAQTTCGNPRKKIDLSKFRSRLPLAAGNLDVKLNITHDSGVSCLEVNLSIGRNG